MVRVELIIIIHCPLLHLNFKILYILCKIWFKTRTGENGISQCKQKNEKAATTTRKTVRIQTYRKYLITNFILIIIVLPSLVNFCWWIWLLLHELMKSVKTWKVVRVLLHEQNFQKILNSNLRKFTCRYFREISIRTMHNEVFEKCVKWNYHVN